MDWTAVVIAVAGIAGTAAGAVVAPIVAERMRREGTRRGQLMTHRLEVYGEALELLAQTTNNALGWAKVPFADLRGADHDEIGRIDSRLTVIGSTEVVRIFQEVRNREQDFRLYLVHEARPHFRSVNQEGGDGEDDRSVLHRERLLELAEALTDAYLRMEKVIRSEIRPG